MDQVEEVKQKTDIVSIIGEYIPLKKAGRNYKANCPFHEEKTPSFIVSPELQIFKCFGCGETGDVYTFLEKYEAMDFAEALRFLAEKAGVKLKSFRPEQQGQKQRIYDLNNLTNRYYQYFLQTHNLGKKAQKYLKEDRGLTDQTIKNFQIGFAPNARGALQRFLVNKKKYNIKEVERSGTVYLKGRDAVDRFRGRIIFPLFDHRGNTVGFAGRILPNERNKDLAKYINSPETPVYHKSNLLFGLNISKDDIKRQGYAIVVEGELDMISSYQAGIKNVVAIKGSALTGEQVRLISRFTKKIILALDSDAAGDVAVRKGIVIAQKEGLEIKVARLEKYKDPDEAAQKNPKYYKESLRKAVGVWDFFVDSVFERYDQSSGQGKAKISNEIVPILASIPDKIVQAHYVELVSRRLNIPPEAVYEQVRENISEQKTEDKRTEELTKITKKLEKTRRQLLEERLLTLAFQSDPKILEDKKTSPLIATPLPKRLLEEYKEYSKKHKKFDSSKFVENLPKELLAGYADMALRDLEGLIEDESAFAKELNLVLRELEIVDIRHRLEKLGVKIREFEENKQSVKLKKSQEKFANLTNKLSRYEEESKKGIILQEV